MEIQDKIMCLLLANKKRVPPWIEQEIGRLDQCYSGYSTQMGQLADSAEMSKADKEFIEDAFQNVFSYVEEQYKQNERNLYHTLHERKRYEEYEQKSS